MVISMKSVIKSGMLAVPAIACLLLAPTFAVPVENQRAMRIPQRMRRLQYGWQARILG